MIAATRRALFWIRCLGTGASVALQPHLRQRAERPRDIAVRPGFAHVSTHGTRACVEAYLRHFPSLEGGGKESGAVGHQAYARWHFPWGHASGRGLSQAFPSPYVGRVRVGGRK